MYVPTFNLGYGAFITIRLPKASINIETVKDSFNIFSYIMFAYVIRLYFIITIIYESDKTILLSLIIDIIQNKCCIFKLNYSSVYI